MKTILLPLKNTNFKFLVNFFQAKFYSTSTIFQQPARVIERLGLSDRSILFTSAASNLTIIEEANKIGVQVLSKDQFFEAEITVG